MIIKVGMADLNVAAFPNRIRTTGLGSCVGVVLYDPLNKIGGMAHVMLPDSSLSKGIINEAKYADTAIPRLIQELEKAGAERGFLTAKLVGGAQMFAFSTVNETMKVGLRNVEACKVILNQERIPVVAEDTGGNWGRTVELDSKTGHLSIRTVNQGEKKI
jgi:chemotaxis protein CheD